MFKRTVFFSVLFLFLIPSFASTELYLPDTGQTLCFEASGNVIDCPGTGQDGEYTINPMSYTPDNTVGAVTDINTGLMWQKCSVGQNNDLGCSGTATTSTWDQAQTICGNLSLGGYSDWRLPSKRELITIVDYGVAYPGPTIEQAYFPSTVAGNASLYWTSTPYAGNATDAWYTSFDYGSVYHSNKATNYYVRCVRGGQTTQSFKDNGNETVTDNRTGLIWQKVEAGSKTWADAVSYCKGLFLGGHWDWRLPDAKELESLTDDKMQPSIDTSFFPNATTNRHWTSTTLSSSTGYAWYASFYDGTVASIDSKAISRDVRCVRGKNTSDMTDPVDGTLSIVPGAVSTTFDLSWSGFTDAESGVAKYGLISSTSAYPACSTAPTYAGVGTSFSHENLSEGKTYYYRVCAVDYAGNVSTGATASKKVLPGYDPPTGGSINIKGGLAFTKTARVTLLLDANDADTPIKMCLSNTGSCKAWIALARTKKWSLSKGDGLKTISAWFRDKYGNATTTPVSTTITLDTVKPVNGTLLISPGAVNTTFDLSWSGFSDAQSGLASYRLVSGTAAYPGCGAKALYAGPGTSYNHENLIVGKTYYYRVCAVDNAGNISTGATAKLKVSP